MAQGSLSQLFAFAWDGWACAKPWLDGSKPWSPGHRGQGIVRQDSALQIAPGLGLQGEYATLWKNKFIWNS